MRFFLAECAPACNHLAAADEMDPEVPQFEFEARLKAVWLHAQAGDEPAYHRALMLIATSSLSASTDCGRRKA